MLLPHLWDLRTERWQPQIVRSGSAERPLPAEFMPLPGFEISPPRRGLSDRRYLDDGSCRPTGGLAARRTAGSRSVSQCPVPPISRVGRRSPDWVEPSAGMVRRDYRKCTDRYKGTGRRRNLETSDSHKVYYGILLSLDISKAWINFALNCLSIALFGVFRRKLAGADAGYRLRSE
jgi:hypothetical protein